MVIKKNLGEKPSIDVRAGGFKSNHAAQVGLREGKHDCVATDLLVPHVVLDLGVLRSPQLDKNQLSESFSKTNASTNQQKMQ